MAALIVIVVLLGGACVGFRRAPAAFRAEAGRAARDIRLRFGGTHALKLVMQHMIDAMFGSVLPSISKSYVPNEMTFGMHPADARRWGGYFEQLADELRAIMLAEIGRRSELHLGDAGLTITLVEDPDAAPGRPTFAARMVRVEKPDRGGPRRTPGKIEPAAVHDGKTVCPPDWAKTAVVAGTRWVIRIADGPCIAIVGEMTVGRDRTTDIPIERSDVSRRHARLVLTDDRVSLVDLDSTNGTWVNDQRVAMAMLEIGDRVRFGRETIGTFEVTA